MKHLFLFLFLSLALPALAQDAIPVTEVYMLYYNEQDTLVVGDKTYIKWVLLPTNTTETGTTCTSSDPSVLQVFSSKDGEAEIEATGPGTADVIVTSNVRPDVVGRYTLHVKANIKVDSITIDADTLRMQPHRQHPVQVTVHPSNAIDPTYRWTNSKPAVATVTHDGLVYAIAAGQTTLTAHANDGSGRTARLIVKVEGQADCPPVAHDGRYLYALGTDSSLLAIPQAYIESQRLTATTLDLRLRGYGQYVIKDIREVTDQCPVELPAFASYKFNNKFNAQIMADAIAEDPSADTLRLPVLGIGKRLTASYQLPDSTLEVYIHTTPQRSKVTRQRFDRPLTYTIARPQWRELELQLQPDSTLRPALIPFGRHTTVLVDWLTDRSTAPYLVPRIDIHLTDGDSLHWTALNYINDKETYRPATIRIQGGGAFPDLATTPIEIKGRGNTSWSAAVDAKNPYHFKFAQKQKPLSMKAGKHWLLIANNQTGSMMTNAIAQRVAQMLGVSYANHILPVELYINGSYRGSYNLTERIALANNSIDLLDDSQAAVLELDTYTDETILQTQYYEYALPVKLKDAYLENDTVHLDAYNAFLPLLHALADGRPYDHLIDLRATAAYLLANEYIANCELKHPKSVFLFNENIYNNESPWTFGPVWDCDWAFGYQQGHQYYAACQTLDFYRDMGESDNWMTYDGPKRMWNALRYQSAAMDSTTYSLLYHFVTGGQLEELTEYVQDYYNFAQKSFTHNRQNLTTSKDGTVYRTQVATAQKWLAARAAALFQQHDSHDLSLEPNADLHPTDDIHAAPVRTAPDAWYDLQGRRLTAKPQRGIYIRNGRKVVVR